MKSVDEIKKILLEHKNDMERKYNVKELGIFGSYVRGEQKEDSDLDVLVDFSKPIGFFKFIELEEYFENLLNVKVEMVSRGALKPYIGKYILDELELI